MCHHPSSHVAGNPMDGQLPCLVDFSARRCFSPTNFVSQWVDTMGLQLQTMSISQKRRLGRQDMCLLKSRTTETLHYQCPMEPHVSSFFGQSQQKSTRANANDLPTHLVAVLAQLKFIPILPIISVTHRSIIDPSDDWLCQAPNLNDHSRR